MVAAPAAVAAAATDPTRKGSNVTATRRIVLIIVGIAMLSTTAVAVWVSGSERGYAVMSHAWATLRGRYTVDERIAMHAGDVETRLKPAFVTAGVSYPPARLAYVAFKEQRILEVHARESDAEPWTKVLSYPVQGMSGRLGPKLREGDLQVPEGIYRAEFLNANSRFHLSIRLNYPNADDRAWAALDGRSQLGSDIMIHGTSASIGCLAMGNQAAEDLFILAALAGKEHVRIVVAPTDFRRTGTMPVIEGPTWLSVLYAKLHTELAQYPIQ